MKSKNYPFPEEAMPYNADEREQSKRVPVDKANVLIKKMFLTNLNQRLNNPYATIKNLRSECQYAYEDTRRELEQKLTDMSGF